MHKRVFFLGGVDLEMMEIQAILSLNKELYYDKQLNWSNALLSAYSAELENYGNKLDWEIYGIELQEHGLDKLPRNYHRIDHHNQFNHLPSSLEQLADILGIQLDYRQQLIAANDKAYIPGMLALGASEKEIAAIRQADRKAQGVTEEDEALAQTAIENKIEVKGIVVVEATSNKFSPICDRLFPYNKLLIYTKNELIYYGVGKEHLAVLFDGEIKQGKMYHGGGKEGYFGSDCGAYSWEELIALKDKIINTIAKLN